MAHAPIKKAFKKERYTKEQIKELRKCSKDPFYFIENYCQVIDSVTGKETLFKLFPYQKRLLDAMQNHRYTVALWPRQSGKTEAAVTYMLWFSMFRPNQHILIAAHKYEHVSEIMKRVKHVYEGLPNWIKSGVLPDGYNARTVKFENGSVIEGTTTTSSSGRGKSINLLYVDEFAFVPPNRAKEFWASIQPTLSATNGKCIITSTPSNDDDEFAQIWHGAINITDEYGNTNPGGVGRNGFKAVPASWEEHPKRDQKWKDEQYAAVGDERWRREFECQFISFDETLINPIFLNEYLSSHGKEPSYTTGTVRWYAPIEPNKTYVVGLDPSMGTGNDPAAIQILQLPEMKQVGEWRHNKTPIPGQVRTMMQILRFIYSEMKSNSMQIKEPEIYWSVENNTIGEAALIVIDETGEDNFPGIMLTESKRKGHVKAFRKGFNTTNKKKLEAASRFKSLVENKRLAINSKALIRELKFFVAKGNSYEAKQGEHDDLVMSMLLVIRMIHELLQWDGDLQQAVSEDIGGGFEDEYLEPMPTIIL